MSDARLRELERSAAQGDLEAHGRLLNERVRAGQIDTERVEFLAHCFWPPAWKALGWEPHGHSGAPSESFRARLFKREGQKQLYQVYTRFDRWAPGLKRWGSTVALRVGAAAARHRWPSWEERSDALAKKGWDMPCPKERVFMFMHMADLQISKPGQYPLINRVATYPLYDPGYSSAHTTTLEHEGRLLASAGPIASGFAEMAIADPEANRIVPLAFGYLGIFARTQNYRWLASALVEACDTEPARVVQGSAEPWGSYVARREGAVYEAIRGELVPWATGERDPVADRIAREARTYVDALGDRYPGDAP